MPVRTNSLEAYREILDKLPEKRATIYRFIVNNPGLTRQQIATCIIWPINAITGRVTELLQHGVVEEYGMDCRSGRSRAKLRPIEGATLKPLPKQEKRMDKRELLRAYTDAIVNYEDIEDLQKEILRRMR